MLTAVAVLPTSISSFPPTSSDSSLKIPCSQQKWIAHSHSSVKCMLNDETKEGGGKNGSRTAK